MNTPEHDLGDLALKAQALRLKVEDWLRAEGKNGRFVTAGNCPLWPEYEMAEQAFQDALAGYSSCSNKEQP